MITIGGIKKKIMNTKEDVLKDCSVSGMIVKLPETKLDRKLYLEVANALELIGGKWKGGKVCGFVFNEDPTGLLAQIANGEKRNLKKEFQFFGTPDRLADRLIELADVRKGQKILEPSAGQGAIVKAINRAIGDQNIYCYELMPINQSFLLKMDTVSLLGDDFLKNNSLGEYDRIIANPPFNKNQDIDHIREMYRLLKDGGRLVSIASEHWQLSNNKKELAFREWLSEIDAEILDVERGAFKESGTAVSGVIIIIDK
jgi:hypothetical protein